MTTRRPWVLLLHGFTDSGVVWSDAVRRWAGFGCHAPDARGHGTAERLLPEQAKPTAAPLMIEDAIAIAESLRAQQDSPLALVGHSMGAGVAAAVGAQRPDLVDALILEDPAWMPVARARAWRDARPAQEWAAQLRADFAGGVAQLQAEHPTWPAELVREWAHAKTQLDPLLAHTGQIVSRTPWTEVAAAIAVPTLLVTGDRPDNTVDDASLQLVAEVGNDQITPARVAGAGHYVRLDQPEGYHTAVDPFLQQHLGRELGGRPCGRGACERRSAGRPSGDH